MKEISNFEGRIIGKYNKFLEKNDKEIQLIDFSKTYSNRIELLKNLIHFNFQRKLESIIFKTYKTENSKSYIFQNIFAEEIKSFSEVKNEGFNLESLISNIFVSAILCLIINYQISPKFHKILKECFSLIGDVFGVYSSLGDTLSIIKESMDSMFRGEQSSKDFQNFLETKIIKIDEDKLKESITSANIFKIFCQLFKVLIIAENYKKLIEPNQNYSLFLKIYLSNLHNREKIFFQTIRKSLRFLRIESITKFLFYVIRINFENYFEKFTIKNKKEKIKEDNKIEKKMEINKFIFKSKFEELIILNEFINDDKKILFYDCLDYFEKMEINFFKREKTVYNNQFIFIKSLFFLLFPFKEKKIFEINDDSEKKKKNTTFYKEIRKNLVKEGKNIFHVIHSSHTLNQKLRSIVCFSFGSELIYSMLLESIKNKSNLFLKNLILVGATLGQKELLNIIGNLISKDGLIMNRIIILRSGRDKLLRYIGDKSSSKPLG